MVTHVGIWLKIANKKNIVEGITQHKMKHVYFIFHFYCYTWWVFTLTEYHGTNKLHDFFGGEIIRCQLTYYVLII